MNDPLGLYVIRCQRNAFWAVLPLAVLAAFACVVMRVASRSNGASVQFLGLLPLAAVLVALTFRLAANSPDLLQRVVAAGLAVLGMSAFMSGTAGRGVPLESAVFAGLVSAAWSLLAATLIPCRPRADGRLAWWRSAVILLLAGATPAAGAVASHDETLMLLVLVVTAPVVVVLAAARDGPPLRSVVAAMCLGAAVGATFDLKRRDPGDASWDEREHAAWTAELALLYGLGAAASSVAARARGLTAVRALAGEPVRVRHAGREADDADGMRVLRGAALLLALVAAGLVLVVRSHVPSRRPPRPARQIQILGEMIEALPAAQRPKAGGLGCGDLPSADANAGIEAVHAARTTANAPLSYWSEADVDGDGRSEYFDAWGRPYVYFDSTDYTVCVGGVAVDISPGRRVIAKPVRDPVTGAFVRPGSFQLFSIGPDGEPGTGDDIVYGE